MTDSGVAGIESANEDAGTNLIDYNLPRNSVVLNAGLAATATKVILYVSDGKKC